MIEHELSQKRQTSLVTYTQEAQSTHCNLSAQALIYFLTGF